MLIQNNLIESERLALVTSISRALHWIRFSVGKIVRRFALRHQAVWLRDVSTRLRSRGCGLEKNNSHHRAQWIFTVAILWIACTAVHAETLLKPFVLVGEKSGKLAKIIYQAHSDLTSSGFTVVGQYSPYPNANILIVTSDRLKEVAGMSDMGGFAAIQRVSFTQVEDTVQVAHTNPIYMANVYRLKADLSDVAEKMASALGKGQAFGAEGLSAEKLRKYHYKIMMPYFDDPIRLAKFGSYSQAVDAVEKGLAKKLGGASKVYRVEMPDSKQTVFGVHLTKDCGGDEYIMDRIDFQKIKSTPHLPYEILVSDNQVLALHAKFRIAQSFPDLSMMGSNSFFSIMCAPGEIKQALSAVVGNKASADDKEEE